MAATEIALAQRGFAATVRDTEARWLKERERASALGRRALILVGASRIQLDMDLGALRRQTGLEPVQLAIDGSSYVPVLQGLSRDPTITGTVVVDVMPGPVSFGTQPEGASQHYESAYEGQRSRSTWPTYRIAEAWMADAIRSRMISYADGGSPWDALSRLTSPAATPQYLSVFADRSKQADYQRVKMPDFYLNRVLRHLGNPAEIEVEQSSGDVAQQLAAYVARLEPSRETAQTEQGLRDLEGAVSAIRSRGGRVIIVSMPTSGLVREADARRFPRSLYWDRMAAATTAKAIYWQDYPALAAFACPDGSHLDKRDVTAFTSAFVAVAGLGRSR